MGIAVSLVASLAISFWSPSASMAARVARGVLAFLLATPAAAIAAFLSYVVAGFLLGDSTPGGGGPTTSFRIAMVLVMCAAAAVPTALGIHAARGPAAAFTGGIDDGR